jgi:hypothetical protein
MDIITTTDDWCGGGGGGGGVVSKGQASKEGFFCRSFLCVCNSHVKRSINVRMYVEDTKFDLTPLTRKVITLSRHPKKDESDEDNDSDAVKNN